MGNCLVQQEKVIKIRKTEGKILEYKSPIKVNQILSDFSGYVISHRDHHSLSLKNSQQYLQPETKLVSGHLYYLVPLTYPPSSPERSGKKKVRFSIPEVEEEKGSGVIRIKVVIRKQELKEMMNKGGVFSLDELMGCDQGSEGEKRIDDGDYGFCDEGECRGWKPVLESIPEVI